MCDGSWLHDSGREMPGDGSSAKLYRCAKAKKSRVRSGKGGLSLGFLRFGGPWLSS